jgi:outer membrane protein assembly factor BamB
LFYDFLPTQVLKEKEADITIHREGEKMRKLFTLMIIGLLFLSMSVPSVPQAKAALRVPVVASPTIEGLSSSSQGQVAEWDQFSGDSAHNGYSSFSGPTTANATWNYTIAGGSFGLVCSSHVLLAAGTAISQDNSNPVGGKISEISESAGQLLRTLNINGYYSGTTTAYPASPAGNAYFETIYSDGFGNWWYNIQANYLSNGGVAYTTVSLPSGSTGTKFGQGLVSYDSGTLLFAPFGANQLWAFIGGVTNSTWRDTMGGTINTIPTSGGGVVMVSYSDSKSISGVSLYSGASQFNMSLDSYVLSSPAFYGGQFYFGTIGGYLYSISSQGLLIWKQSLGVSIESTPTVSQGLLYVGADNGTVFALNASNPSSEAWSYTVGGEIISPPTVSNNSIVYVATTTGYVYALNSSTGSLVWKYNAQSSITSSLVLDNGYLFAVTNNGEILAFAPPTTYDVTFTESGLPSGTMWGVNFNGQTQNSTSNSTTFSTPNGVYAFSIISPNGYTPYPSTGNVTVNGANVTQPVITFTQVPEFLSFLILPLFMIATLLAVTPYKKRIKNSQGPAR